MVYKPIMCGLNNNLDNLKYEIAEYLNLESNPHLMIVGNSGSGKTYAAKYILTTLFLFNPASQLFLLDFKGDDSFDSYRSSETYFKNYDVEEGFSHFYKRFKARMEGKESTHNYLILAFDEYAAYILSLPKKHADEIKAQLAQMLMLGRSLNVHLFLFIQRPDAQLFNSARANISNVIALGKLSKETAKMVLPDDEIEPQNRGEGYLARDGKNTIQIHIPNYNNFMDIVDDSILSLLENGSASVLD